VKKIPKCHRDEAFALFLYIVFFIVILFVLTQYDIDTLSVILILLIVIPLILDALNRLNSPCRVQPEE